jgi:WD40-like Beta Propeller Repeat
MCGMRGGRRLWLVGAVGVVCVLVSAGAVIVLPTATAAERASATASAPTGSIVYRKGGNVWVARGDGSRAHVITRDGAADPYRHPTQANNGVIAAARGEVRGTFLVRINRRGGPLGKPVQVAVGLTNAGPLHEIGFAPALSPDGSKVALYKALLQGTYDPNTGVRGLNLLAVTVQYRNAVSGRKLAERHHPGDYLQSPSWIDNRRLLVFAPYNAYAPQVWVDRIGGKLVGWFGDQLDGESSFDRKTIDQGELSRDGRRLALIRGTNVAGNWRRATIQIYSVNGFSAAPEPFCRIRLPGRGPFAKPTWSPDGTLLAWSDRNGIWSSAVTATGDGCGSSPRMIIRGGAEPDWGPASGG